MIYNKNNNVTLQVVVITGASSGIGEALAHAFYEQGSKVVLAARREPELNRVKNDLISKNLVSIQRSAAKAHATWLNWQSVNPNW